MLILTVEVHTKIINLHKLAKFVKLLELELIWAVRHDGQWFHVPIKHIQIFCTSPTFFNTNIIFKYISVG